MYSIKYYVDILVHVADELKSQYNAPSSNRNHFYGLRFEEWVVSWSHIQIEYNYEVKKLDYWRLKDWRGDKRCYRKIYGGDKNSILANSSLAPDLTLVKSDYISDKRPVWDSGDEIYVECKWSGKNKFELKKASINNYKEYIKNRLSETRKEHNTADDLLYYVFGVGWDTFKKRPIQAYIVQGKSLHDWLSTSNNSNKDKAIQGEDNTLQDKYIITKENLENWCELTKNDKRIKEEDVSTPFTHKAINKDGKITIYYRKVF